MSDALEYRLELFTILLCTWVSVHPNIPGPDEEWPRITYRRVGIMLATLIVPELVIAWAIRQRVLAHELAEEHEGEPIRRLKLPSSFDKF
jgi:hypothetical protein